MSDEKIGIEKPYGIRADDWQPVGNVALYRDGKMVAVGWLNPDGVFLPDEEPEAPLQLPLHPAPVDGTGGIGAVTDLHAALQDAHRTNENLGAAVELGMERLASARGFLGRLRQYASHQPTCNRYGVGAAWGMKCSCGYDELIEEINSPAPGQSSGDAP